MNFESKNQQENNLIALYLNSLHNLYILKFFASSDISKLIRCNKHFLFLQTYLIECSTVYSSTMKDWVEEKKKYIKFLNINTSIDLNIKDILPPNLTKIIMGQYN